jgi:hypothetical protein
VTRAAVSHTTPALFGTLFMADKRQFSIDSATNKINANHITKDKIRGDEKNKYKRNMQIQQKIHNKYSACL